MAEIRPSWQLDPCPSWCAGGHREQDHPDDRVHSSAAFSVPVVLRRATLEPDRLVRSAEPGTFEVGLARADGESDTWLYIGEGPAMFIEVSVESARRLLRAGALRIASPEGTYPEGTSPAGADPPAQAQPLS